MQTIVAADIGGTNCRIGMFKLDQEQLINAENFWLETGKVFAYEDLLEAIGRRFPLDKTDVLVFAIAGPVEENVRGRLSNGQLVIDLEVPRTKRPGLRFALINDFMAQAYAIGGIIGQDAVKIGGPSKLPYATRAIIGAGTGLGYALLTPAEDDWIPQPSENGHSVFPFTTPAELDFGLFLCQKLNQPYARGDDVLTGRGLEVLHEYLTGEKLTAAKIGESCLSRDCPTMEWYARFYGRACRNWILCTLCAGGLWISGGIAAKNAVCMQSKYFMDELYNSWQWSDFLHSVPLRLVCDQNSGLWGAALFAKKILAQKL